MTDDSEKGVLVGGHDLETGSVNALLPPPPPSATGVQAASHTHARARTWPEYFHYILTPEILQRGSGSGHGRRSTAYLDGLRGVAAFLVYFGHHVLGAHGGDNRPIEHGYGYKGEYRFINLPYVRTIFSGGHFSVAIFFVISGFVLARKPLTLMHAREYDAASINIGSGMFRRGVRLFMPVIVCSFIYMSTWHIFGVKVGWPEPKSSYAAEIRAFFSDFLGWSFVLRDRGFPIFAYNFPAWSLPVEYQGSMVTFALLIAFARIKIRARLILSTILSVYFLHMGNWACFCFIWGQTLAELDLLVRAKSQAIPRWVTNLATSSFFCNLLLLFGLFLGGQPHTPEGIQVMDTTPVWSFFAKLMPTTYREGEFNVYWLSWAGVCVTTAVVFLPWTHNLFNGPMCQYLGRVSFSFYLTHGPILWTLGARLYAATGSNPLHDPDLTMYNDLFPLPQWGPYGAELGFWICQAFLIPFSLFWAEVTMRAVDEPSVTLAQALFRKVAGK